MNIITITRFYLWFLAVQDMIGAIEAYKHKDKLGFTLCTIYMFIEALLFALLP